MISQLQSILADPKGDNPEETDSSVDCYLSMSLAQHSHILYHYYMYWIAAVPVVPSDVPQSIVTDPKGDNTEELDSSADCYLCMSFAQHSSALLLLYVLHCSCPCGSP